jgi:hypothetical protein
MRGASHDPDTTTSPTDILGEPLDGVVVCKASTPSGDSEMSMFVSGQLYLADKL